MSVTNGSFDAYMISNNSFTYIDAADNTYWISLFESASILYFPGWIFDVPKIGTNIIISNGGGGGFETGQTFGKQSLIIQQRGGLTTPAIARVSQSISFNSGNYTLSFKARRREGGGQTLSVGLSNGSVTPLTSKLLSTLDDNWRTF
jgi:hypothetical protein